MEQDDPDAFQSEVLGEFRAGVSTFLDPDAIAACVGTGIRERLPAPGVSYVAFCDSSGGRRDAFTLGIAHRDTDRSVLDVLRAWCPPFNPTGVIAEVTEILRSYRLQRLEGDRYAGEFVAEQFRARGITYGSSDRDRSGIYQELLPLINSQHVVLLDEPELLRELRGLERRRAPSGRDRVDHAPGRHDDRANAAAGALVLASQRQGMSRELIRWCLEAGSEPEEARWAGRRQF
jgi:hypothetical protein